MSENVGKIRDRYRYSGDPNTSRFVRLRKEMLDDNIKDKEFMDRAMKDTAEVLRRDAQYQTDKKAGKK